MKKLEKPINIGKWVCTHFIAEGGNGRVYLCKTKDDDSQYSLKLIKFKNKDKKLENEIKIIKSIKSANVSNIVDEGQNDGYRFYVYNYIEGCTLQEIIESKDFSFIEIVNSYKNLLNTFKTLHSVSILHRDIKPDNLVCRNGDINDIVILDFGLSHSIQSENFTPSNEQLNNRFLSLPEFLVHSNNEARCRESDITLLNGIFLYMLTKTRPITLLDSSFKLPHQRDDVKTILKLKYLSYFSGLIKFFDKAFQQDLSLRYKNIEEVETSLGEIFNTKINNCDDYITKLKKINFLMDSEEIKINEINKKNMDEIIKWVQISSEEVYKDLKNKIQLFQTWYETKRNYTQNIFGFKYNEKSFKIKFMCTLCGSNYVLSGFLNENTQVIYENINVKNFSSDKQRIIELIKNVYLENIFKFLLI